MQQGRADLPLSQRQGKGRFRTAAILEEQIRSLQQLQRAATNYCIFKTQTWISQAHHAEMTKATQVDSWMGASLAKLKQMKWNSI